MQLFTRLFLLESSFVSRVYESAGGAKGLLSEGEFKKLLAVVPGVPGPNQSRS